MLGKLPNLSLTMHLVEEAKNECKRMEMFVIKKAKTKKQKIQRFLGKLKNKKCARIVQSNHFKTV